MKISKSILGSCFFIGVLMAGCTKKNNNENLNEQDGNFLIQASITNNAELGAATLALTKGNNPAVTSYANHMMAEHSAAKLQLLALGTSVGFNVPVDTIDNAHKAIMAQLSSMSGRAFDSMYITSQVLDHNLAISMFQQEVSAGNRPEVKAYANEQLPHLTLHKQRADSIKLAFFP